LRPSRQLSLLRVLGHPQGEVPSAVDTGEPQEHGRARDGIRCEGSLRKQSDRANDQASTTERRNAHVRKPALSIEQNQPDFVPRDWDNFFYYGRDCSRDSNRVTIRCRHVLPVRFR